jgi:cell division protein FtsA
MVHREPAAGMRRGIIVDLPEASSALARALHVMRSVSKDALKNITVNVGTPQLKAQSSRGIVAVSRADSEICEEDVERVGKASQSITAPNRMVVHALVKEYVIDGVGDILDPIGLTGARLEVQSVIVDEFAPHIKNIFRVVELVGGKVQNVVGGPIAASRAALTKAQKESGTLLIDMGAGTTSIAVWQENKLHTIKVFPVGSLHITNDLAVALKVPADIAETVKLQYGTARPEDVSSKEMVDLKKVMPDAKTMVSRRYIAEIIEARLAEIYELVQNELKSLDLPSGLAGGAMLVGGGSRLPGITDLATRALKLSARLGTAVPSEWHDPSPETVECFEDPEYVIAAGLALWGAHESGWQDRGSSWFSPSRIAKYFMP